jgi:hypothetical protein
MQDLDGYGAGRTVGERKKKIGVQSTLPLGCIYMGSTVAACCGFTTVTAP